MNIKILFIKLILCRYIKYKDKTVGFWTDFSLCTAKATANRKDSFWQVWQGNDIR